MATTLVLVLVAFIVLDVAAVIFLLWRYRRRRVTVRQVYGRAAPDIILGGMQGGTWAVGAGGLWTSAGGEWSSVSGGDYGCSDGGGDSGGGCGGD